MSKHLTRFEIVEKSMSPALHPGDFLLIRKRNLPPSRGDIVVCKLGNRFLVKRVIALGGEHLAITGGVVLINGETFFEPWWNAATRPDGEWDIPAHACFLLGDNRPRSADDSRTIGAVHVDNIVGTVIFRYWPPLRMGRLLPHRLNKSLVEGR